MTRIDGAAPGAAIATRSARQAIAQRFTSRLLSAYAEQHLHRQLIEAFVSETALASRAELGNQGLYLRIGVPLSGALLEDEIRAHAAAGEIANAVVVLGPVGVRIEVTRAGVSDVLEELH